MQFEISGHWFNQHNSDSIFREGIFHFVHYFELNKAYLTENASDIET